MNLLEQLRKLSDLMQPKEEMATSTSGRQRTSADKGSEKTSGKTSGKIYGEISGEISGEIRRSEKSSRQKNEKNAFPEKRETKSSEEDLKKEKANPYSYGLESIYRLETVDPHSVRKLSDSQADKSKEWSFAPPSLDLEPQLTLELGENFQTTLPSFCRDEPIQVLELSQQAQQALLNLDKRVIGDLMAIRESDFRSIKGLGQGHIDEVQRKLSHYLKGQITENMPVIDFLGFIRCLVSDLNKLPAYLLLEPYGLSHLIKLTAQQNHELKRLSLDKRQEMRLQGKNALLHLQKVEFVQHKFRQIAHTFIMPWLEQRHFLALKEEITERLLILSVDPKWAQTSLNFFSDFYYSNQFPLDSALCLAEENLYVCSQQAKACYQQVIEMALSYFYQVELEYPVSSLAFWIKREFALKWNGFQEGFIEKVLRYSPLFCVRKGENELLIKLA